MILCALLLHQLVVDAIGKHGKMPEIVENAMKIRTTSLLFNCCTFGSILRLNSYISQYLIAMGGFDGDRDRDNSAAVVETLCACVFGGFMYLSTAL